MLYKKKHNLPSDKTGQKLKCSYKGRSEACIKMFSNGMMIIFLLSLYVYSDEQGADPL